MLSKQITRTDAFLDMPLSSQSLYFHLNTDADDEWFVWSPKSILRLIWASEDDLKLLLLKRFILSFESWVIVIKHRFIHNNIRKDRFEKTKYTSEKQTLKLKENSSYTEYDNQVTTKWQPHVSIDKNSIDKNRLEEISLEEEKPKKKISKKTKKTDQINFWEKFHCTQQEYDWLVDNFWKQVVDDIIDDYDTYIINNKGWKNYTSPIRAIRKRLKKRVDEWKATMKTAQIKKPAKTYAEYEKEQKQSWAVRKIFNPLST